ncbi:MAG: hypothetical protein Q8S26_04670 [Azonexus sp.]|nr:hypothetical protein [Azonexus sp.]
MANVQPSSVSLKINKSSVMLYANRYVALPGGGSATAQTYLGSFPRTATEVPSTFEVLLRESTLGRPERYLSLMQRITLDVLIPARLKREQEECRQNRAAIGNALRWATQNLQAIPRMPAYPTHIGQPDQQAALKALLEASEDLAEDVEVSVETPLGAEPDTAILPPEERLMQLLKSIDAACIEIAALMPEQTKAFKRGYVFQPETVSGVQRLWFRSSDVIAALSARSQFRRARNWSGLRAKVLDMRHEAPAT